MKSFVDIDQQGNGEYLRLLSAVSRLSRLFSESRTPYINSRVVENIFCRSFGASNLSRTDTAFDANYNFIGIGLKTFIGLGERKSEKVAEFNQLSGELKNLKGKELALRLANLRNERIDLAYRTYNIQSSLYHIVARKEDELLLFETDYDKLNIDKLKIFKSKDASLQFEDGNHLYSYNFSKSTLFRQFDIPKNAYRLPINIVDDPFNLLLDLFKEKAKTLKFLPKNIFDEKKKNAVILPLYRTRKNKKFVNEKSGLNAWNASGRKRGLGEVWIPIPIYIHKKHPGFFPPRDTEFKLEVPTGEIFQAKVCQDGLKALMTNPNKALSDWILRRVFKLKEGELATIEKMEELGFDSVIVEKDDQGNFKIDKAESNSYEAYINLESSAEDNG